jgi:hypothetical protein
MDKFLEESRKQVFDKLIAQIHTKKKEMALEEGRKIVRESDILLILEYDIASAIVLDTIKNLSIEIFSLEYEALDALSRFAFSPKWDTLEIWALSPNTNKPTMIEPTRYLRYWLIMNIFFNTSIVEVIKFGCKCCSIH